MKDEMGLHRWVEKMKKVFQMGERDEKGKLKAI